MNDFIIYVLKSVLALALFALVYRISLLSEGNFRIRRMYLLLSSGLAMILPILPVTLSIGEYPFPSILIDEVVVYNNGIRLIKETSSIPLSYYVKLTYFAVSGIILLRILISIVLLMNETRKNEPDEKTNVRVYLLKDKNISYSFFRNIFIGQTADREEQERIVAHEKVHATQLHSIDVIYMEILSAAFWFNPLIWWYRDEIRNVHEYLADEGALETGFNRKEYQITILEHLIGSASISITNNFNYSLIKNRIAMMNKEKNGRKNTWKVFLLIPLSLLIVLAFACTEKSSDNNAILGAEKTELNKAYFEAEQMPVFPGGMDAIRKFIATTVTYPKEAAAKQVQGRVFVQFVVDKTGKVVTNTDDFIAVDKDKKESTVIGEVTVIRYKPAEGSPTENVEEYIDLLKKEAVRVVSLLPAFEKPGMQNGEPVAVVFTIPINFALQ